ncbi:acyl-CoA synthetase (AMP-forming)/AMP-acid ligase II [Pullulanibacillus pueri]|uniref:AMP-dependent ligase n=1 Tax=Pullulanibacillus pueri TaxID=1437324 RepID=A0A8J2ZTZ5_9BACL|nr:AMP-binding protein [Pullulanibacillus pueri]MBM7681336.1 acyl-CoA synthetase (AMP-forming)/AMP-acid ligase II [Pullulanibacillus pueri]GGH77543.1 AMP-dependent ligase [Pullulanibacillus pueri]
MSQLTERIHERLAHSPLPCLYDMERWITGQDFYRDMTIIKNMLFKAGIKPGARILLSYPNSYAFVVTYLAIIEYGAAVAPINPKMPESEFIQFLERCQPTCGFVEEQHLTLIKKNTDTSIGLTHLFLAEAMDSPLPLKTYTLSNTNWIEHSPFVSETPGDHPLPSEETVGVLLYTSGTTGNPKAVGLKHRHLLASANNIIVSHQLDTTDVAYSFLPLFHINAQVVSILSTILSGGRVVLAPKFSVRRFWPTIQEHQVTWVSAVPTIIAILLTSDGPTQAPTHLRFVRSASAQLPMLHARRFEQKFGVPIIESYGMTEAASQICINPIPPNKRILGSVGLPVGLDLQIVNESNQPLAPNKVGEITIRGNNVIEYYEKADHQNDFQEGWFHTGDLGYLDKEGYVYIVGRKKEMINVGGEKISPYEVEDEIRKLSTVKHVAVIGLPDPLYGEKVVAYIIPTTSTVDEKVFIQDIHAHCIGALSHYKCPSEIHVVSEIPIGPTGKIQRFRLKEQELLRQKVDSH